MKKYLITFILFFCCLIIKGQFTYGTTGMLHMPTAEMQKDKTLMFGSSILDSHILPSREWWGDYSTFNYYLNITVFPWLEIGYTCVLVKGKEGIYHWPEQTWGKLANQDRSFHGRLRLIKEKNLGNYMPSVVIGLNDPTSGSWDGGSLSNKQKYNGFFCRYYLALTKHIPFRNIGELGTHLAYVYNKRKDYSLNGLAYGINFRFLLSDRQQLVKLINNLNFMAEYDSRTINIGAEYSFWKDYINVVVEFNRCRYFSGGVIFKVHLK